jgi:hypothetical protein
MLARLGPAALRAGPWNAIECGSAVGYPACSVRAAVDDF